MTTHIQDAVDAGMRYEDGNVFLPSGKIAQPRMWRDGYFKMSLGKANNRRSYNLARVICWLVYGPPPTNKHMADHINRNTKDDRPENLRWASPRENALNVSRGSRKRQQDTMKKNRVTFRGEDAPWAKLTTSNALDIKRLYKAIGKTKIAARFGVHPETAYRIYRGTRWAHLS